MVKAPLSNRSVNYIRVILPTWETICLVLDMFCFYSIFNNRHCDKAALQKMDVGCVVAC